MPEKLGFGQGLGESGAIDIDQFLPGAGSVVMKPPGNGGLAGAETTG